MGLLSAAVTKAGSEFVVRVGERTHRVRIEGERAVVDGELALQVLPAPGGRTLVREAEGPGQRLVTLDGQAFASAASVAGVAVDVEVRTAQAAALAGALGPRAGGAAGSQLKAPMPGRVVRVLVAVGQAVERGAPVVIVEAMKMENEMHAPASGTVLKLHVAEGATVDAGQLLVELELG
jgi:biotin carboxyl carrier protein